MAGPYTTTGERRGGCGHRHGELRAAARCIWRDRAACVVAGAESDRRVVRMDGLELDADERETLAGWLAREVRP